MINTYGSTYLVNLVNHKGHELPVKDAFERNMVLAGQTDPQIANQTHYVYFDFHTECRKMRFDRISLLIDRLGSALDQMRWYHSVHPTLASSGEVRVMAKQGGVIRSNCMDCLDRTNVAQSALGRWVLNKQLREVGILSVKETIEEHEEFMAMFRTGQWTHACAEFSVDQAQCGPTMAIPSPSRTPVPAPSRQTLPAPASGHAKALYRMDTRA